MTTPDAPTQTSATPTTAVVALKTFTVSFAETIGQPNYSSLRACCDMTFEVPPEANPTNETDLAIMIQKAYRMCVRQVADELAEQKARRQLEPAPEAGDSREAESTTQPQRGGQAAPFDGGRDRGERPQRDEPRRDEQASSRRGQSTWGGGNRGGDRQPERGRDNNRGGGNRGGGGYGPPRTGRALFAHVKKQEEDGVDGLVKHLNAWAKRIGLPYQMSEWNGRDVADALIEVDAYLNGE